MAQQGIPVIWRLKVCDRLKAVSTLIKQQIFYRNNAEIEDFKKGLNVVCGLWDRITEHPLKWKEILCHKSSPLDKGTFLNLLEIEWSPVGSNRKFQEDDTIYCWEVFLQDVEEGRTSVSFREILVFITGSDVVPIFGFPEKIKINFYTTESGVRRLPSVSTCALILSLPRGISDPDLFEEMIIEAIQGSAGFGKI